MLGVHADTPILEYHMPIYTELDYNILIFFVVS